MKTLAKLFSLFVLLACSASQQASVVKTVDDATACAVGVVAATQGTVDVKALLACGLTVADALGLVTELRAQAFPSDAGAAALSPERVLYAKKLDQLLVDLKEVK